MKTNLETARASRPLAIACTSMGEMLRNAKNRKENAVRNPGRWRRFAVFGVVAAPAAGLALWIAVNRVEWLGPLVADSLRAVIGVGNVAELENFTYGVQDRVNQALRAEEKPKAYWTVPPQPAVNAPLPPSTTEDPKQLPPFRPKDVGPALKSWSAPGDGQWVPVSKTDSAESPRLFKTLLHPDASRSWAEVFVVAIDLRRVEVRLVAGRKEPVVTEKDAENLERPGVIPPEYSANVLAAFNGGFKTEHGQWGMGVDGVTLVAPRQEACTIARYKDGSYRVATWAKLMQDVAEMTWWRQTPHCMYEDHVMHAGLRDGLAKKWGGQLDGQTVIRRSAVGIDDTHQILYMAISNHTTAQVIAEGMHHAGAKTVAQLDVNFSYPKFVTFEPSSEGKRLATALAEGFEFSEDEFIRRPAPRDFFYVLPRAGDQRTASSTSDSGPTKAARSD